MKTLKQLGAVVAMTFVLGVSVLGAPPCTPGDISTPPCAAVRALSPGETSTPAAGALGQTDTPPVGEMSLTEIASSVLLSMVSLF
ncbi:MAG TPA: hypothetical protein VEM96_13200 [Pyrinomonadaceae bacterium]|nr:hypothetical protein [Pyrinomonadaceae bacterium]